LAGAVAHRGAQEPQPIDAPEIWKTDLAIRFAWEIGRHDPDIVGIHPDDRPVRPEGKTELPVDDVLAWLRSKKTSLKGKPDDKKHRKKERKKKKKR
jgi:hypothetical protein